MARDRDQDGDRPPKDSVSIIRNIFKRSINNGQQPEDSSGKRPMTSIQKSYRDEMRERISQREKKHFPSK